VALPNFSVLLDAEWAIAQWRMLFFWLLSPPGLHRDEGISSYWGGVGFERRFEVLFEPVASPCPRTGRQLLPLGEALRRECLEGSKVHELGAVDVDTPRDAGGPSAGRLLKNIEAWKWGMVGAFPFSQLDLIRGIRTGPED
jgi:hypothetical protein